MDGWTGGQADGWMDGWMDGRTDGVWVDDCPHAPAQGGACWGAQYLDMRVGSNTQPAYPVTPTCPRRGPLADRFPTRRLRAGSSGVCVSFDAELLLPWGGRA